MKCEQILCITICEFDKQAAKPKFVPQSRPALYNSQQQVELFTQVKQLKTSAKFRVFVLNISSLPLKWRYITYRFLFLVFHYFVF